MTPQQQRAILAAVIAGCSWTTAALAAGVAPEQLHNIVEQAQQSGCRVKLRFVHRLKQAGKVATETTLQQHRKGGIDAQC
jgi:hypothetical protein